MFRLAVVILVAASCGGGTKSVARPGPRLAAAPAGHACADDPGIEAVRATWVGGKAADADRAAWGFVERGGAGQTCRAVQVARVFLDHDPARALTWALAVLDVEPEQRAAALVGALAAVRVRRPELAAQLLTTAEYVSPPADRGAASLEVSRELSRAGLHAAALSAARQALSVSPASRRPEALDWLRTEAKTAGREVQE